MLDAVLSIAEPVLTAATAQAASAAFHAAARRGGASYLQTRVYRRPPAMLTSESHWAAGGFVARYARPGWEGSAGFDYICFEQNPLLKPIREGLTRYRFSDYAPHDDKAYGDYWSALSEAGMAEALCATSYASGRRIASLHLGFPMADLAPETAFAWQMAGLMLTEKLLAIAEMPEPEPAASLLSRREREAVAFVAAGKTDWEIATILGVSAATARFHVDNARRKLGAVNRAHAVARFYATHGIDAV